MARTPYPDSEAEAAYQDTVKQSSKPSYEQPGTWPEASFGGRSSVEVNNPELDNPQKYQEYKKREDDMEKARRRK